MDTHALVWYIEDSPRLGGQAGAIMDDPRSILLLPVIALAEACWVVEHRRCSIPSVGDLIGDVYADPRITIVSLTREILDRSLALTAVSEMHDRLIVATAIELAGDGRPVPILTTDGNVRESGLVPVIW